MSLAASDMLSGVVTLAPPAFEVEHDWPCMRCGYNVRGLAHDGRCPECGHAVAASLAANPIRANEKLHIGAVLLAAGMITWMSLPHLLDPFDIHRIQPGGLSFWSDDLDRCGVILLIPGAWLLTRNGGGLRWLLVSMFALALAIPFMREAPTKISGTTFYKIDTAILLSAYAIDPLLRWTAILLLLRLTARTRARVPGEKSFLDSPWPLRTFLAVLGLETLLGFISDAWRVAWLGQAMPGKSWVPESWEPVFYLAYPIHLLLMPLWLWFMVYVARWATLVMLAVRRAPAKAEA